LAVLTEREVKRCPLCHGKLRKRRGAPIVLGETSRLDMQATMEVDRQNRKRVEHGYWNAEPPAPVVDKRARPRDIDLNPEPAAVEPAPAVFAKPAPPEPVPCAWFDAQAEPVVEAEIEFVPEPGPAIERTPEPEPVVALEPADDLDEPYPFFDVAAEPEVGDPQPSLLDVALAEHVGVPTEEAEPAISDAELGAALDAGIYSAVDALHRKARGEASEEVVPTDRFEVDEEAPETSLPVMASAAGNRRRWSRRGN
jgi:hypothetical protein